jgi:hypothetical protein
MMRVTPLRLTTLQCSQIGFTLVRTFTVAPNVVTEIISRLAPNVTAELMSGLSSPLDVP